MLKRLQIAAPNLSDDSGSESAASEAWVDEDRLSQTSDNDGTDNAVIQREEQRVEGVVSTTEQATQPTARAITSSDALANPDEPKPLQSASVITEYSTVSISAIPSPVQEPHSKHND